MPNSFAGGRRPEPIFCSPISVHSLRPSVPRVPERAKRLYFHNDTLYNFGAAAGSLVLCAAIVVAGSDFVASGRDARRAQAVRELGSAEIAGGDGPASGGGNRLALAKNGRFVSQHTIFACL
jgi:hypothetical protein